MVMAYSLVIGRQYSYMSGLAKMFNDKNFLK